MAESQLNPNYSFWYAFIWPYEKYVNDPGNIVNDTIASPIGKFIATLVGFVGVAIFVVPTGMIATGMTEAMKEVKRQKELKDFGDRITMSFRRRQNKQTHFRFVPRRISITTLQTIKNINTEDIIGAVSKCEHLRLRNLADVLPGSEHPVDRLAVEMIPFASPAVDGAKVEKTKYGIKIDRKSNITIVAPNSVSEHAIGHFAYYLSLYGGFNYVSKEFEPEVDEPVSFYTIENANLSPVDTFVDDITNLSKGKDKWNIILLSAKSVYDTQFHFIRKTKNDSKLTPSTTLNEQDFLKLYQNLSQLLKENYSLGSDLDQEFRPVGNKNIGVITGGGLSNNAFTLRIAYSVTAWDDRWQTIVVDMAKLIKALLEKSSNKVFDENNSAWKLQGCGFRK